ncbi:glycosyltransferase [Ruegeria profundi]|uniref:glycosyltransferase n=1 Tax=Ruegeria profundi TaxID=1685378 RepID=UPI001CD1E4D9|nr:glycosyltransferase [Ruegeria profundi]MCA0930681.1 glycosyltransferase [Ruegeria profundi]
MTKVLLVSGRGIQRTVADCCAQDFEDCILDAARATLFLAEEGKPAPTGDYDLVIVVGLNFRKMATTYRLAGMPQGRHTVAYVFGGYGSHTTRYRDPVKRLLNPRYRAMTKLDKVYVGIPDAVEKIQKDLALPVSFLPMAADVLGVQAQPFETQKDRPVSVAGFGRLHSGISAAICDRLNRPGSEHLYLNNSVGGNTEPSDKPRYRATFWHTLRKTQISLAFDHFFANEKNTAEHSYVGPRWFESLAAGTVIAGVAPEYESRKSLLDWEDATIDLSADPETAADEIDALLADPERLHRASRLNLINMNRRHDWRHRLAEIYSDLGLTMDAPFKVSLDLLARRADQIAAGAEAAEPAKTEEEDSFIS